MIPTKLTYFFCDGYFGSVNPFLNLFYISLGLTATQAGLISGISYAVSSISGPLWGSIADGTGHRKLIFIIMCVGTASTVFPMPWIAQAFGKYEKSVCHGNLTVRNSSDVINCVSSRHLVNSDNMFYIILTVSCIARIFFVGLPSYVEGIGMNVVKNSTKITSYGVQKLFGSIGYALFNFIAGVAIDHYKPEGLSEFTSGFFVFLFCILVLVPIGYVLVGQTKWDESGNEGTDRRKMFAQLISVCRKFDSIVFLLTVAVSGVAINIIQGFGFMLMKDYMHASSTAMTIVVQVCMISDFIFYPLSSRIIKLFGGPFPCIIIGIFSYFPRYVVISYISNQWLMVAINLVHGVGLALSWTAQMEYSYQIFPPEIRVTGISIVSTINTVATGSIANAVGGIVYHTYGGRWLLRGCGILCGAWSIFIAFYYGIKRRIEKSSLQVSPIDLNDLSQIPEDNIA